MLALVEKGSVRTIESGLGDPNYPAFAPDGALYVSDSGSWGVRNGCALTADGQWLWIVESREPTVNPLRPAHRRARAGDAPRGTVPDGVAFTADGGVLISCYRPDRIVHLDRGGRAEVVAEDPRGTLLAAPTNVAFAGRELDRLVSANLGRWHLALIDSGLRGVPLHYPAGWAADR